MNDDRMTAWEFSKEFAQTANRAQLALVAVCGTLGTVLLATVGAGILRGWALYTAGAGAVLLGYALFWLLLGLGPVQRWIKGKDGS